MTFQDETFAGGILVQDAAESPNYIPLTQGWALKDDGSADLAAAVIRGILDVVAANGSEVKIYAKGGAVPAAVIEITPPASTDPSYEYVPADIHSAGFGTSGANLILTSAGVRTIPGGFVTGLAVVALQSGNTAGSKGRIALTGDVEIVDTIVTDNTFYETPAGPGQSFVGTAMASVTGLDNITIPAGQKWLYKLEVAYDATVAGKAKFCWASSSANLTIDRSITALATSAATNIDSNVMKIRRATGTQQAVGGTGGAANAFSLYEETGRIENTDASAQTLTFQAAENALSTGMTVQGHSWFKMERYA